MAKNHFQFQMEPSWFLSSLNVSCSIIIIIIIIIIIVIIIIITFWGKTKRFQQVVRCP